MNKIIFVAFLLVIYHCYAFSGGAPEFVCEDMAVIHLAPPQISALPYKVSVDRKEVKGGETLQIEIGGDKFKGLLVEVRKGNKARGKFLLEEDENDFKTITCNGFKNNALTHQNNAYKKNKKLLWKAPKEPGKYIVYVTIAKDRETFWMKKPTEEITIV